MMKIEKKSKRDSIIDDVLDSVSPIDDRKIEHRLLLAARIADLIAEKGYSKKQFADLMDKEPSVISKWLGGTHNFTQDTLSEISFRLGISMVDFYQERQNPVVFRSTFDVTQVTGITKINQTTPLASYYPVDAGLMKLNEQPFVLAHIDPSAGWLDLMGARAVCTQITARITGQDEPGKSKRKRHPEENTVRKA
ncbi:helix-turn-helix domain-containing protein [Mucilaginibacter kameinonensis]|uniref:helix-turn-helix domain-containing protein n=1 Tax=Mucilaginibacter kameinonensis TaxID=452286 RepID=UPI0013CE7841|nr:helix-turn-helix transcriptional regulator [Mucilaginibacter kameinonensis]